MTLKILSVEYRFVSLSLSPQLSPLSFLRVPSTLSTLSSLSRLLTESGGQAQVGLLYKCDVKARQGVSGDVRKHMTSAPRFNETGREMT